MNYGSYMSASGVLANLHRMDVWSNNLANVNTPGFKADVVSMRLREAARVEDPSLAFAPSNAMLERLGAGVKLGPSRVDLSQGSIEVTNRELDLALRGNGFFTVSAPVDGGGTEVRLTRDGRLSLNARREMVMAASGLPVLDDKGKPIALPNGGQVKVDGDGRIRQGGVEVGRLAVVSVDDAETMPKAGEGLFRPTAAQFSRRKAGAATVEQGALERSGVDPIAAMLEIGKAERAVGSNLRMIQIQDELMQRTIGTFARLA
ncbi:MAG: flagellar hook-basal body protein [Phycisphaerae bacterium]|nr:flagellar hook-basal body protein [Phycisphaerae bacterium]